MVFLRGVMLLFLTSHLTASLAMRCQQSLVYEGDTQYIVQKKCGEPLAKQVFENPELLYNQYGEPYAEVPNPYEIWTYQKSPSDFLYEILFQDGVVKSITARRSS